MNMITTIGIQAKHCAVLGAFACPPEKNLEFQKHHRFFLHADSPNTAEIQ